MNLGIQRLWLSSSLGLLLTCACASTQQAEEIAPPPGAIIAASNFLHPPFSSRDESQRPVGIEVDLIERAAARLGREVEWIELPFGELIQSVADGHADVAASTIGVTEERARLVAFTESYFETTIIALVRQGADEPTTLADLSGKRVVTERGTTAVGAGARRLPDAVHVLDKPEGRAWGDMLVAGEVDAVVLDRSHAEKFMRDAGAQFHVIEEPLRREPFALVTHPDADVWRASLNAVILEERASR